MNILSVKRAGVAVVLAAALGLGGCNAQGFPGLSAGATGDAGGTLALAAPDGNTPPGFDKLAAAKEQFRERNFGLAEKQFREIAEKETGNAEAWLGLAASYDQLRRFDLADRAYGQVAKLTGENAVLHNNRGYSYLLRGNRAKARAEFARAQRLDPQNAFIRNNISAL